jgi:phosphohistidine swiveling domain-containing protein
MTRRASTSVPLVAKQRTSHLAQIIRRELGIPCVNGVVDAIAVLKDGELVTVDGYLGIVFIGKPEFDRERTFGGRAARAADR